MGGIWLCHGKTAVVPYYMEQADVRLYSYEELCYFLYHNLYLFEREMLNENFVRWLDRDLELPVLAGDIREMVRQNTGLIHIMERIFEDAPYLNAQEIQKAGKMLRMILNEPESVKRKKRGDRYVELHRYEAGIREYRQILENEGAEAYDGFYAQVYHNLGTACARMFRFKEASEYYMHSYRLKKDPEVMLEFTAALRLGLPKELYAGLIQRGQATKQQADEVEKRIQELQELNRSGAEVRELERVLAQAGEDDRRELYSLAGEWKREFRKNIQCRTA